jgi:predicted nuclease of restriction endonuclease-like RecB superfamily
MLKTDLLRVRLDDERNLRPAYVSEKSRELLGRAEAAIELFRASVGITRGELEEKCIQLEKGEGDIKLNKGLVELLLERAEFQGAGSAAAVELRTLLFEKAAARFPVGARIGDADREEVVGEVAARLGLAAADVDRLMFSDLKEEQVMERFESLEPLDLLRRYNVALAQGTLLHATSIDILLQNPEPRRLRQLFRYLKFFRLLFLPEFSPDGGRVAFRVDGPLSALRSTKSYGVKLASFLPALLLLDDYEMVANVKWKRKRCEFRLGPGEGLVSHYRDTGSWMPEEMGQLVARFREVSPSGMQVVEASSIVSLGGREVYVPDVLLRRRGCEAMVEVFWPWKKLSKGFFEAFVRHAPGNALLCVSVKSVTKTFQEHCKDPRILFYRATPLADQVVRTALELVPGLSSNRLL